MRARAKDKFRGFHQRFAERWVRMYRHAKIGRRGAHLDGEAESRGQFRNAATDGLNAEHQMVVGPRDDPDEAFFGLQGHGAAIGRERELADRNGMAGIPRFVR